MDDNTSLGHSSQFKWNTQPSNTTIATTLVNNSFSMLDGSRGSTGGDKEPYHSKGSMERDRYGGGGGGSRSGSQHGSRENSAARNFSLGRSGMPSSSGSSSGSNTISINNTGRSAASQSMHAMGSIASQAIRVEKVSGDGCISGWW